MHPSNEGNDAPGIEMPRYQSHKKVWALQIKSTGEAPGGQVRLEFEEAGYAPIWLPLEMFSRYMPVPGDYYVVYDDGYKSISPAKAFEEGYRLVSGGL